ncbi:hypothetical protein INH39_02990 [Massilia violaceinigra]|uniref:Uncharacterized protein n=1 Tax=Massilia violaceinigra TaxID=2045208 RepID=A0ABY4A7G8_9BURK|nr:hypothetical protein [Massilia violaceinigra]UOD30726.1 hypothetical protein INH39_02990 [Massilia violaceinigra]
MKNFVYENTGVQQGDVICYAFSPDLIDASEKELKHFLSVLSQHFPKTENGVDVFKPMDNQPLLATFNSAYQNVTMLIADRKEKSRYFWSILLSALTFCILVATLLNTFYVQGKGSNPHVEKLPNKLMQAPPKPPAT